MCHHSRIHPPPLLSMKDGSHKKKPNGKSVSGYLPGNFFSSGEQQDEGHGVVQCVEGEYHHSSIVLFSLFINQLIKIQPRT